MKTKSTREDRMDEKTSLFSLNNILLTEFHSGDNERGLLALSINFLPLRFSLLIIESLYTPKQNMRINPLENYPSSVSYILS